MVLCCTVACLGGCMRNYFVFSLFFLFILSVWAGGNGESISKNSNAQQVVNVYSSRSYDVDREIYNNFTAQTGIVVNEASGSEDELLERVVAEGQQSELDILFFADAGRLARAKSKGLLSPIDNSGILSRTSSLFQDKDTQWIAITMRGRVIVYDKEVGVPNVSSYGDLAKLGNARVLVRSSSNSYNISLLSYLIASEGKEATALWTKGLVKNLARNPEGNDRDQMRALIGGIGNVAIVNTYYIGLMASSSSDFDRQVGERIGVIFPEPTNINISGMGIGKYSKNRENAEKLITYFLSSEVQTLLTNTNFEYPVVDDVEKNEFLATMGTIHLPADDFDFNIYENHSLMATQIADENGWN